MFQVLGDLFPYAVGIALSPFPVIAIVLVLATPKASTNGVAFAVGWVGGLTVATTLILAISGGADDPTSTASDGVSWVRVLLGVALLSLAVRTWRGRPAPGADPEMPPWMAHLDDLEPPKALALGALLSGVNPKNLALVIAAATVIAQAGLTGGEVVVDVVLFVAIASATVAGAVLAHVLLGEKAASGLAAIKGFMLEHNDAIMVVILVLFGVKLLGDGLGAI